MKSYTNPHLLCGTYPEEFAVFLDYTRALRYDETPNYKYLCSLFCNLLIREGHKNDHVFDWCATTTGPDNGVTVTGTIMTTHRDSKPLGNRRV
jgi:casein kinase I family protein HRR25